MLPVQTLFKRPKTDPSSAAPAPQLRRRSLRDKNYRRSAALLEFGARFTGAEDSAPVIEEVLRSAVRDTGADAGYIMLADCAGTGDLMTDVAICLGEPCDLPLTRGLNEGAEGWVAARGESIVLSKRSRPGQDSFEFNGEALLAAPLLRKNADGSTGEVAGVLALVSLHPKHEFTERDIELAQSLAALATITLANDRRYRELRESFLQSLVAIARTVEAKVPYMDGHGERVALVAVMIARQMNLSNEVLQDLSDGALLHEIGKIGIPDSILLKPEQLTEEEFAHLKQYPVLGFEMCRPLGLGERVLTLVRNHPERLDGTGYPDQLKFSELPLPLRILCVADAFDAMSSYRPYRHAMDKKARQEQLNRFAGTQFDPVVVETLKGLLAEGELESLYQEHWAKHLKTSDAVQSTVPSSATTSPIFAKKGRRESAIETEPTPITPYPPRAEPEVWTLADFANEDAAANPYAVEAAAGSVETAWDPAQTSTVHPGDLVLPTAGVIESEQAMETDDSSEGEQDVRRAA